MDRLLLVDDDPLSLSSTQMLLENHGYRVDIASKGDTALDLMKIHGEEYSLVLLDYRLEHERGESVVRQLLERAPNLYILIYSGDTTREAVKESWKAGAVGFLEKGQDTNALLSSVSLWCSKFRETRKTISLPGSLNNHSEAIRQMKMVGRSKSLATIAQQVARYRPLKDTVLVLGETGTGKEKIAQALHSASSDTFFAVNCASYAASVDLMESELFGSEKGAYTGSIKEKVGVFEAANGGTVFLDEVHSLNPIAQQKLLRVLQERTVRRVGGTREIPVQFRLVVAAKPEIIQKVERNEFLPDLFERFNVLHITLSPLRERREDIEPLVAYFCELYEKETGEKKAFLYKTLKYLEAYPWPRNVRELENTVRRLCVNVAGTKIEPEHLDPVFFEAVLKDRPSLRTEQEELLKTKIEKALQSATSQREAARLLRVPESTLRRMIKKLEIESPYLETAI